MPFTLSLSCLSFLLSTPLLSFHPPSFSSFLSFISFSNFIPYFLHIMHFPSILFFYFFPPPSLLILPSFCLSLLLRPFVSLFFLFSSFSFSLSFFHFFLLHVLFPLLPYPFSFARVVCPNFGHPVLTSSFSSVHCFSSFSFVSFFVSFLSSPSPFPFTYPFLSFLLC